MSKSTIDLVTFKKYNPETQSFIKCNEIKYMNLSTFMAYLNNLPSSIDVHWSIDFLNPDFTTATVYVEF